MDSSRWCFFFPPFLFLFPSVNCFSTLFFSENHFLLTVEQVQRLRPSLPRQQSCVLGEGQCSHSVPFPWAKALLPRLPAANEKAQLPEAGGVKSAEATLVPIHTSLPPALHFPEAARHTASGCPWSGVKSSPDHPSKPAAP